MKGESTHPTSPGARPAKVNSTASLKRFWMKKTLALPHTQEQNTN